ncbi:hypothetical protein OIC43_41615 [Streptomyces sp. NBC_00825]|uniref:hypothetical protein n=1 Tax=unclassified Streptomyces TaxID=2593676 RepID=UPI002250AC08|nr:MULTISPECIES: hypothetical protein [unclassified Streptomyces]WTB52034.1 hypothetical protein OG832_02070 [Streptomyces sp. NBC_00826]WTH95076.1 hypothetical protein OIC43_41615 [Streptomyces sp. NBC_00825]WTI03810.1 hypothetical protein OHA23_41590 [Streptomyces sp. NBC_00822]MCX4869410.1 hypothetical protein [Streptomyces sp. NBC_00906]MCX4900649.1 hypothetical protein [Streptomyces sp. NBC_00892]
MPRQRETSGPRSAGTASPCYVARWCAAIGWPVHPLGGADDTREDTIVDLGPQWGQYEYVTNIGFAA